MHIIKNEDLYRALLPGSEKYSGIGNITIEDSGDHIIITCTISKKDLVTVVSTVASPNTPLAEYIIFQVRHKRRNSAMTAEKQCAKRGENEQRKRKIVQHELLK